jgi:hypothetical protein
MPRLDLSSLPGAARLATRLDRAIRWRADQEIGLRLDGLYGRLDQLNDRVDELERRLRRDDENQD